MSLSSPVSPFQSHWWLLCCFQKTTLYTTSGGSGGGGVLGTPSFRPRRRLNIGPKAGSPRPLPFTWRHNKLDTTFRKPDIRPWRLSVEHIGLQYVIRFLYSASTPYCLHSYTHTPAHLYTHMYIGLYTYRSTYAYTYDTYIILYTFVLSVFTSFSIISCIMPTHTYIHT